MKRLRTLVAGPVEQAQLFAMIRATPWAWSLGLVGVVITFFQYGTGASAAATRQWLAVIGTVVLLRLLAWARWQAGGRLPVQKPGWAAVILGSNLLFAAAWGLLSLLLREAGPAPAEGILHVTLAAVAMGGTSRLAGFDRTMVAYVALVLAPLVARAVWLGSSFHAVMVVLIPMIGVYALFSGLATSRALRDAERQRHLNAQTATRLQLEVERGELARSQLVQAGLARTRIFAAANHDLRQPLHAVGLLVQALRLQPAPEPVHALAERLQHCTEGLADVVDELIELARADAELPQPRRCAVALRALLDTSCRPYVALAAAKGLPLTWEVPPVGVHTDPAMLGRIVGNLVSNAVRYTSAGEVSVRAMPGPAGTVQLHIADTGLGIAAEHLPHIFEPFYQAHSPGQERRQGSGLGLATVRRFATLLNISLQVDSTPGQGSCFTLTLPVCELPPPVAAEPPAAPALPFSGRRVLTVEDDPDAADALAQLLQAWGCKVFTAPDAGTACHLAADALAGFPPDALLADLRLSGPHSGLQAVQQLQDLWGRPVPTLLMTGTTEGPDADAVRQAGLPLLPKPVSPARLRAFLAQAFARKPPR